MEILDNNIHKDCSCDTRSSRNIFAGVAFILAGVIWLLYNFNLISESFFDIVISWQMLMIVIGVYLISMRKWAAGGVVAGVGLFFLITELLHVYIPVGKVILPVVFIAIGLSILLAKICCKR